MMRGVDKQSRATLNALRKQLIDVIKAIEADEDICLCTLEKTIETLMADARTYHKNARRRKEARKKKRHEAAKAEASETPRYNGAEPEGDRSSLAANSASSTSGAQEGDGGASTIHDHGAAYDANATPGGDTLVVFDPGAAYDVGERARGGDQSPNATPGGDTLVVFDPGERCDVARIVVRSVPLEEEQWQDDPDRTQGFDPFAGQDDA